MKISLNKVRHALNVYDLARLLNNNNIRASSISLEWIVVLKWTQSCLHWDHSAVGVGRERMQNSRVWIPGHTQPVPGMLLPGTWLPGIVTADVYLEFTLCQAEYHAWLVWFHLCLWGRHYHYVHLSFGMTSLKFKMITVFPGGRIRIQTSVPSIAISFSWIPES
jgi:hypothetical protein